MLNQAIKKITEEISKNKDNAYTEYVGEYVIDYIKKNPQYAKNILNDEKSILGSLKHMEDEARKKAKNNMAVFTPEEGFKIVLNYFEIKEAPALKVINAQKKIDISLDDLL